MKKFSLFIAIALIFSHQITKPADGIVGSTIKLTVDVATSDFAFTVYKYTCVAVATVTAKTLMEPALAKYRRATNTENINELHARAQLREKFQELDQADFQFQIVKMKMLSDSFGDYHALMQKRLQAIKESSASEEEKQRLMAALESRLKATESKLSQYNTEEFEKLVNSTADQRAQLLEQAKKKN